MPDMPLRVQMRGSLEKYILIPQGVSGVFLFLSEILTHICLRWFSQYAGYSSHESSTPYPDSTGKMYHTPYEQEMREWESARGLARSIHVLARPVSAGEIFLRARLDRGDPQHLDRSLSTRGRVVRMTHTTLRGMSREIVS